MCLELPHSTSVRSLLLHKKNFNSSDHRLPKNSPLTITCHGYGYRLAKFDAMILSGNTNLDKWLPPEKYRWFDKLGDRIVALNLCNSWFEFSPSVVFMRAFFRLVWGVCTKSTRKKNRKSIHCVRCELRRDMWNGATQGILKFVTDCIYNQIQSQTIAKNSISISRCKMMLQ